MTPLNKHGFSQLIAENIAWLEGCTEKSLERDHIIAVLRGSIEHYYPSRQPGKVLCDAKPAAWMSQVISEDERNLFEPVLHLDDPKTGSGPIPKTRCRLVITPLYAAAKGE